MDTTCSFPGCGRRVLCGGICRGHYWQRQNKAELTPIKTRGLSDESRFWGLVDIRKPTECWLWMGSRDMKGYGKFTTSSGGRRTARVHRISYELAYGLPLGPLEVDHACFNRACVNPAHLNAVTRKQNMENRSGARAGSRSGIRGVHPYRDGRRWTATVGHYGRVLHIGIFDTIADAEAAAIAKRNELFTNNLLDRKRIPDE